MPRIMIDAVFTVRYAQTITKRQLRELEDGANLEDVVDVDSDGYRRVGTEGDLDECDWELIKPKPRNRKK